MKFLLSAFALLFGCLCCYGQLDSTKIPFISYWSTGDAYDFRVTKIRQEWRDNVPSKNDSFTYIAHFEVVDSTPTTYTINWTYENNLSELNIPPYLMEKFAKYRLSEITYKTSEVGDFLELENWREVGKMMQNLMAEVLETISEEEQADKAKLEQMMQPLLAIYENKDAVEQLVFKELQYFHFPFGIEISIEEPIVYEELLPNTLGGDPIRGDAKIYVDSLDIPSTYCLLIQEMKLNPEDTKVLIVGLLKRMQVDDEDLDEALKEAEFDIIDYNQYGYYLDPGLPVRIETRRESIFNFGPQKGKRVDVMRIELVK